MPATAIYSRTDGVASWQWCLENEAAAAATTRFAEWVERGLPVPLVVIDSPFRETVRPRSATCASCVATIRAT